PGKTGRPRSAGNISIPSLIICDSERKVVFTSAQIGGVNKVGPAWINLCHKTVETRRRASLDPAESVLQREISRLSISTYVGVACGVDAYSRFANQIFCTATAKKGRLNEELGMCCNLRD